MDSLIAILTVVGLLINLFAKASKASKEGKKAAAPGRGMPQPGAMPARPRAAAPAKPAVMPMAGMPQPEPLPMATEGEPLRSEPRKSKKKKKKQPVPVPVAAEPERPAAPPPAAPVRPARSPLHFSDDPLVQAIILSEVLDEPKSMR